MRTVSLLSLVALTAVAGAMDHPQEARKFALRSSGVRSTLSWTSKLPAPTLPASSPTVVGARLRVAAGSGESAWLDLPASGWAAYQSGTRFKYVFQNKQAPLGPSTVKIAVLDDQKVIRVSAKSSGITLDETTQGTVAVQLFIGGDVYCSECTTPTRDQPGSYKARLCPSPASCPSEFCGNGVVDQSSEECDQNDPGVCASIPIPFDIACQAPGSPDECECCSEDYCFFSLSFQSPCCGPKQCQDTTGFGSERLGACIPPSCSTDADCNGYRCENGTCCGNPSQLCGVVGCCLDSGATCTFLQNPFVNLCCKAPGGTCAVWGDCCSFSCTAGVCD